MLTLSIEGTGGILREEGGFVSPFGVLCFAFFAPAVQLVSGACVSGYIWWYTAAAACQILTLQPQSRPGELLWCDSQQHCVLQPCACGAVLTLSANLPSSLGSGCVCVCLYGRGRRVIFCFPGDCGLDLAQETQQTSPLSIGCNHAFSNEVWTQACLHLSSKLVLPWVLSLSSSGFSRVILTSFFF